VSDDGLSPAEQLDAIDHKLNELVLQQQLNWRRLRAELAETGIIMVAPETLGDEEIAWLEGHFLDSIFPVLTPLAIDPAHPFPFIPNLGLTLALQLCGRDKRAMQALIRVPGSLERFIQLPRESGVGASRRFVMLEDTVSRFIPRLFPGYEVVGQGAFRVIRDSDIEVEEEAEDLVRLFERALKRRRRGSVIRLEVEDDMPEPLRRIVQRALALADNEVPYHSGDARHRPPGAARRDRSPGLEVRALYPAVPRAHPRAWRDCFATIRQKDMIVPPPVRVFRRGAAVPAASRVRPGRGGYQADALRTSNDSPIVKALIEAAEAGKSVTALVELKARFDEEANIKWARDLERRARRSFTASSSLRRMPSYRRWSAARAAACELCACGHGQLPSDHRAHLHGPQLFHDDPVIAATWRGCSTSSRLRAAAGPEEDRSVAYTAARPHPGAYRGETSMRKPAPRPDLVEDELAGRPRDHRRALSAPARPGLRSS
jgi:polyphosphate kinase